MNRTILYSQEQMRSFDFVQSEHDLLYSISELAADMLGQTVTVVTGIAATQTSPTASLSINLAAGDIYQLADADAVAVGAIPQDLTQILQQGTAAAQQVTLTAPGTSGQSQWALIQAQFSQVDIIRASDPNGGVLFYYNAANPSQPLQGPSGGGGSQPTERTGQMVVEVVYGGAATTGSEVPPNPTSGWVPLYLIDLAFGQTQITNSEILVAGPSVGSNVPSNYPHAPFLAGLLNSHHGGISGQAPQIKLASEVQGQLPPANLSSLASGVVGTVRGLSGSGPGTTQTASWTVSELIAETALGGVTYKGTSLSLSFNGAITGAGGMDTGTLPASSEEISIYAIYNPGTATWNLLGCLASESNGPVYSGAYMPAGYTASALICGLVTSSAGNIPVFEQADRKIWLNSTTIASSLTAATYTSLSLAVAVPKNAKYWFPDASSLVTAVTNINFAANSTGLGRTALWASNSAEVTGPPVLIITPQTTFYEITASGTWDVSCVGYEI